MHNPKMQPAVLHVCLSKGWGGLEQYPLSIATELLRQGLDVHYWALQGSPFAQKAQTRHFSVLTFASRFSVLCRCFALQSWVTAHNIQAIHFHKSSDLRLVPLLRWLLPGVRLVFTEHMNAKKPKHSLYHRWVYRMLHQVIAISNYTLANNIKALPVRPQQIQRLYAGIDLDIFKRSLATGDCDALRTSLGLQANDVACCLPGRISPGKGHRVFIDAVAHWAHKHSGPGRVHAFIVGGLHASEGADEALVHQLQVSIKQMGLEHLFTFTGYSSKLQELLQAMDMVCIPSAQEAFGLAVVEAMALGLPVVGSSSGAIPEILGNNGDFGLLADPNSPASFAHVFLQLSESPSLRQAIGQKALQRVRSTFNLQDHVKRLIDIYQT